MVSLRDPARGWPDVSAGHAGLSRGKDHSGGIQVIARAAAILRVLERRPDGLSLGQIAKATGLSRSMVQRIVAALAIENFVTTTGIAAGLIGIAAAVGSSTVTLLRPHLRALREDACETVDLGETFAMPRARQGRAVALSGFPANRWGAPGSDRRRVKGTDRACYRVRRVETARPSCPTTSDWAYD